MKLLLLIRLQQDRNGRIFDQSLRRKTKSLGYIEKESAVCCLEKRSLYQSSLYESYLGCITIGLATVHLWQAKTQSETAFLFHR
jgi:hypothetical protein